MKDMAPNLLPHGALKGRESHIGPSAIHSLQAAEAN